MLFNGITNITLYLPLLRKPLHLNLLATTVNEIHTCTLPSKIDINNECVITTM